MCAGVGCCVQDMAFAVYCITCRILLSSALPLHSISSTWRNGPLEQGRTRLGESTRFRSPPHIEKAGNSLMSCEAARMGLVTVEELARRRGGGR